MGELATFGIYVLAAMAELGGCFAVWSWARNDASAWWLVPGALSLAAFAWILTRADTAFAGRAFAAYGGVYIVASLGWFVLVEHGVPTEQDMVGIALCLVGAALILSSGLKV
jgi:small multidrug resistance family-3 protein